MKNKLAVAIISVLIFSISGLTSCKNRSEKLKQKKIELEEVQTIKDEIKRNVYPIPTSAEVIKMLSDLGVDYIVDISNPPENVKKYFTSTKQATNLGAYGADLSYATLYDNQQEILNYLNAIRSLSNELNMSEIYDESLYEKIKDNVDNKDSLVNILTTVFNSTYAHLSENDQQALALLVVGGAWVEGMYLTTHVSEAAYHIAGISGVLLKQKESFERYLEITQNYTDDPGLNEFIKSLDPIKNVYAGLSTSLTQQNITDIAQAITEIRNKIVS